MPVKIPTIKAIILDENNIETKSTATAIVNDMPIAGKISCNCSKIPIEIIFFE
jgi:hypothetical protein